MVGRVAIAGFQRGRRYAAVDAQRDFLGFYEVNDLSVLTSADYLAKANAPSPLTQGPSATNAYCNEAFSCCGANAASSSNIPRPIRPIPNPRMAPLLRWE